MNEQLLNENRSLGFAAVSPSAPAWVRARIVSFRQAVVGKRSPSLSTTEIRQAEQRSLALGRAVRKFVTNLFPRPLETDPAAIAKRNGLTLEAYEDSLLRDKAKTQAAEIRKQQAEMPFACADDGCNEDYDHDEPDDDKWDNERHERACSRHFALAQRAKTLGTAELHYAAVDVHKRAARP